MNSQIQDLNIEQLIASATVNYFSLMLSMDIEMVAEENKNSTYNHHYIGCVYFNGEAVSGLLEMSLSHQYGQYMAAKILCMPPEEVQSTENVLDVLQESANIIGGNFKSELCNLGIGCRITPPSVFDITAYKTSSRDWGRSESYIFKYEDHFFSIRVYLTP